MPYNQNPIDVICVSQRQGHTCDGTRPDFYGNHLPYKRFSAMPDCTHSIISSAIDVADARSKPSPESRKEITVFSQGEVMSFAPFVARELSSSILTKKFL
mmetsp:Transcript_24696/g.49115  ORF Transcript_24696/g.49115 Transcript_24696/m.49115 type:complete len:100 (-) Transcript_24696:3-302(-)